MDLFGWRKRKKGLEDEVARITEALAQAQKDLSDRNASHEEALTDMCKTITIYNTTNEFIQAEVAKRAKENRAKSPKLMSIGGGS